MFISLQSGNKCVRNFLSLVAILIPLTGSAGRVKAEEKLKLYIQNKW